MNTQFLNAVRAAQAGGLNYTDAFNKVFRERRDLTASMKHSEFERPASAIQFTNASSPLGQALYSSLPGIITVPLQITKTDSDDAVMEKIRQAPVRLGPSALGRLRDWIVGRVRWVAGIPTQQQALAEARQLFPEIFTAPGVIPCA
jgi:hypothetical protein